MGLWAAILGVVLGLILVWQIHQADKRRQARIRDAQRDRLERIRLDLIDRNLQNDARRLEKAFARDLAAGVNAASVRRSQFSANRQWEPYMPERDNHQEPTRDDGLVASMAAAAATDSVAVGVLAGGNILGAVIGESLVSHRAYEPEPCRPEPRTESYSPCEPSSHESSPSYDSGSSCDSSPSWSE